MKKIKTKKGQKIKLISRISHTKKMYQIKKSFPKKVIKIHQIKESSTRKKMYLRLMPSRKMYLKFKKKLI